MIATIAVIAAIAEIKKEKKKSSAMAAIIGIIRNPNIIFNLKAIGKNFQFRPYSNPYPNQNQMDNFHTSSTRYSFN